MLEQARIFARRHRVAITIAGSLATIAALVWALAGKRHEFAHALTHTKWWVLVAATALQVVGLLARSEAWHLAVEAAGGRVPRRVLFRASAMQVLGGVINGQLGVAARIAALRRSSPEVAPQVPTLIASEVPLVAVEMALAALTSFTFVGPLGLPWWSPIIAIAVAALASHGLRRLALKKGRELWKGLAIVRSASHGWRLVAFMVLVVHAQIFRNWLLLHAVGVHASFFDSIAVLITIGALTQLPVGPGAAAAAAVLILGRDGVAATAAAGVLLTVTGTLGGFCFATWAGADMLHAGRRRKRLAAAGPGTPARAPTDAPHSGQ